MADSATKTTSMKYVKLNSAKTQNVAEGIQTHANTLKQTNVNTQKKENNNTNIYENLKEAVKTLKAEIKELERSTFKATKDLFENHNDEIGNLKQQIADMSISMSEMMIRIVKIKTDDSIENNPYENLYQQEIKCDQCIYLCRKEKTLRNHIKMNMKLFLN